MDYKEIIRQIRTRQLQPVYFLHGEEPFFIDEIARVAEREILAESEKAFNQTILYGKEADSAAVVDVARRYPMMAERQVVILKEAQQMGTLANLLSYVERPQPSTVLIIAYKYKKLDQRSAFAKSLQKNSIVFESKPLYENQLGVWINGYVKERGFKIETEAAELIVLYVGNDLGKIVNELEKLFLNLIKGATVGIQAVQENIGLSKEYNVFELQKALGSRQVSQVYKIVLNFAENPKNHPLVMVISALFTFFSKLYMLLFAGSAPDAETAKIMGLSPFFLKDYRSAAQFYSKAQIEKIIGVLKEFDLKSKGVGADNTPEGSLLKEMIFKILQT